jgi:quinolinate synthase
MFDDIVQEIKTLKEREDATILAHYYQEGEIQELADYINSTAAVKALSDWIVTSGNAEEIIRRVPEDREILFVPDRHLGQYLQEVTGRKMILWDGSCMVHEIFSVGDLLAMKKKFPHAVTLAHPECPANVREHSDFVGGTEGMVRKVGTYAEPTDFLVATEANMMWQLQHRYPQHRFHGVPGISCACNKCPHMARNTLEKLRDCLANGEPEIHWDPCFDRAREALERSLLKPVPVAMAGD